MGLIKSAFFWLFNFGGNIIQNFKDNYDKEVQEEIQIQDNLIEIETGKGTCSQTDSISDAYRVSRSEGRSKLCDNICYWNANGTSVQSTKCVNDRLICYCQ